MMTHPALRAARPVLATLVAALCGAVATMASAQEAGVPGAVTLEINRVENVDAGCRIYLVTRNGLDAALDPFTLDLVAFDGGGVIAARLAVDLAPVPAGKTMVRLFDVAGPACEDLSALLLNDVVACGAGALADRACLDRITVVSRAPLDLRL